MLVGTPPPPIPNFYIFFSFFLPIFLYSPKYINPSRNNLIPPPPIILTSWKILAATFRNILTTQACNHLNQTTQTKYQPNCQLFLKTFNPCRLQKQSELGLSRFTHVTIRFDSVRSRSDSLSIRSDQIDQYD